MVLNQSPAIRILLSIAVALATFLIVLDYSIANVSIPYIAGDLGVSNEQGTYVITSFAVGNAIGLSLTGWLTERMQTARLLVISLLLFIFFSLSCALSREFSTLISSRFFQGLVAGPLLPLSQTLMITVNPPEKKHSMIALWSTVAIIGPVVGPVLGGWISFDYTWPWIFYINLPVGLCSAAVIAYFLWKVEEPRHSSPLDVVGLILLSLGMGCLQVFLDKGEQYDWLLSPWMRFFCSIACISTALLFIWSWYSTQPLIRVRLFRTTSYLISCIFMTLIYAVYFGTVVLIPLWLQQNMGYNSIWAGLALCPIGFIPIFLAQGVAKLMTRIGKQIPILMCLMLFAGSCFYNAFFDTNITFGGIAFSRFLFGFGVSFFITPLFALSMQDIQERDLPSATSLFHLIRAMSGAAGTSIATTLWIRRSAYHHQILGENITPFSSSWRLYEEQLHTLGIKGKKALALFNQLLDDQGAMLALNDCFYAMAWAFVIMIPFTFFIRSKKS